MTTSLIALANASGTVRTNKKKFKRGYYSTIVNHLYSTVSKKFMTGDYELTHRTNKVTCRDSSGTSSKYVQFIFLDFRITLHNSIDYEDFELTRQRISTYYMDIMHYDDCFVKIGDIFNNEAYMDSKGRFRTKQLGLTLMVVDNNSLFNILMRYPKFREKIFP